MLKINHFVLHVPGAEHGSSIAKGFQPRSAAGALRTWERWLLMVSQAADPLDWIQPCLSLDGTKQECCEHYREQGRCRAGLCWETWAEKSLWGLVPAGPMQEPEAGLGWGAGRLARAGCWRLSDSRAGAQVCMCILSVLLSLCAQQDHSCHLAQLWRALWRYKDILLVTIATPAYFHLLWKIPFSRGHQTACWWENVEKSVSTGCASALWKQRLNLQVCQCNIFCKHWTGKPWDTSRMKGDVTSSCMPNLAKGQPHYDHNA